MANDDGSQKYLFLHDVGKFEIGKSLIFLSKKYVLIYTEMLSRKSYSRI